MSRIAKKPVPIPQGVECTVVGQELKVKGPNGAMEMAVHQQVMIQMGLDEEEGGSESGSNAQVLTFKAKDGSNSANALAGTMRALANNIVIGVSTGFERQLELVGVGYRAQANGNTLNLSLGFSHPVNYQLPPEVSVQTPNNTTIVLKSYNKQVLGQAAAEIRSFRPPEPYKGKGIRYANEQIIRKEAKKK
jgi:large subunit ribosomal protein L6